MNNRIDPIKTNANFKRAIVGLSNEQVDDPVHRKPSEEQRKNYGSCADIMVTIVDRKMLGLFAREGDDIYAKRLHSDVLT